MPLRSGCSTKWLSKAKRYRVTCELHLQPSILFSPHRTRSAQACIAGTLHAPVSVRLSGCIDDLAILYRVTQIEKSLKLAVQGTCQWRTPMHAALSWRLQPWIKDLTARLPGQALNCQVGQRGLRLRCTRCMLSEPSSATCRYMSWRRLLWVAHGVGCPAHQACKVLIMQHLLAAEKRVLPCREACGTRSCHGLGLAYTEVRGSVARCDRGRVARLDYAPLS